MPIYEYLCNSCGAEKEHLQKINDAPITVCPVCGSNHYTKLISAAGFQLKGSGWYVTDFKNNKAKQQTDAKPTTKENTQPVEAAASPAAAPATVTSDTAAGKESSAKISTAVAEN